MKPQLLSILFLFSTAALSAQVSERNQAIKFDLLDVVFNTYALSFEQAVSPKTSFELTVGYGGGFNSLDYDPIDRSITYQAIREEGLYILPDHTNHEESAYVGEERPYDKLDKPLVRRELNSKIYFQADFNYYPGARGALNGFYFGPQAFVSFENGRFYHFTDEITVVSKTPAESAISEIPASVSEGLNLEEYKLVTYQQLQRIEIEEQETTIVGLGLEIGYSLVFDNGLLLNVALQTGGLLELADPYLSGDIKLGYAF